MDKDRLFLMYAGIVAMKAHPRNEGASIDLKSCFSLALAAMEEFECWECYRLNNEFAVRPKGVI